MNLTSLASITTRQQHQIGHWNIKIHQTSLATGNWRTMTGYRLLLVDGLWSTIFDRRQKTQWLSTDDWRPTTNNHSPMTDVRWPTIFEQRPAIVDRWSSMATVGHWRSTNNLSPSNFGRQKTTNNWRSLTDNFSVLTSDDASIYFCFRINPWLLFIK